MTVKKIVLLLLVVALGALIVYRITKNKELDEKGGKDGKKPPTAVQAIVLKSQEFTNVISVSGSVEANEQIDIHSEVSGVVKHIFFTEGSFVNKGQALLKIDDSELKAQLSQAKTKQALAAENAHRVKLLLEKEAISKEEYDITTAEYKTLQAQTQLILAQLAKTTIKAPFSGKIGLRSISTGSYITPAVSIASLVSNSQMKITFSIPEKYAQSIKNNTEVSCSIPNTTTVFSAKIYAIEPAVETTTRTLRLRAFANNAEGKLIAGTFAKVDLPLQRIQDAILIPSESVIPVQKGKKVFVAQGNKAKEIMIETLTRTDKEVIVTNGLKAGDTLITTGIMSLKNDAEIKLKVK